MATPARTATIAGGIVGGVLVVAAATFFGVSQVRADEVIAGVTVEGLDLGGLGREDATAEVEAYAAERSAETIVLVHEDEEFLIDPVEVGAALDVDAVVDEALAAGRDGSWFEARWAAITGVDIAVPAPIGLDEELVRGRIDEIAATVDTAPVEGSLVVDPVDLTVDAVRPADGVRVLVGETVDEVVVAFDAPGEDRLDLPVEAVASRTDEQDITDAVAVAERAVAADLVLVSADGQVTLTPRELAPMITSEIVTEGGDSSIVLTVTPAAVEEHVVPVADPLLRDPRNASFEAPRTPPRTFDPQEDAVWRPVPASVSIIAGQDGTALDIETLATELTAAIRAGERRIEPELVAVPPPFSTQDAEDAGVDHLLSTFTTYHACCQTRVTNIQRLAELVDNTTVMPGEQFSVNQISGVRTCEKGFAEAGMILDGEIVDVCGGGVSQFGTTTINAVFFAGLDPDAYKPHSFYISRYPMAREATLNYPSPDIDVRFTNDTGAPIIVRTTYTGTSITVSFYGNPTATEVRADLGSIYNVRSYETERRINRDLPPGTSTTIQSGADGFSVGLTRTIVRESGGSDSDDWTNTYVAKKEIVEYNPAPPPEPTTTDG